jgi:hypothetical protein
MWPAWGAPTLLHWTAFSQVPCVAVLGSGGGVRALIAYSGACKALQQLGLLDCIMFIASLSGSSWWVLTHSDHVAREIYVICRGYTAWHKYECWVNLKVNVIQLCVSQYSPISQILAMSAIFHPDKHKYIIFRYLLVHLSVRVSQKVSGLATWNKNSKWYSSLPLGAVVPLFCESV